MKDPIDTAIDQVSARMVQVREDEDLALRIAAALPARSTRFSWLIPQFAAIAAFAIAAVVWTMRDPAPTSLLPSSEVAALVVVPSTVAAIAPGTGIRTMPLEPLEHLELLEPLDGDHERSLPAIDALAALVVSDVTPDALPGSPALTLAPIEIADLPMTAESFSPR
jgi:hypothetical protein